MEVKELMIGDWVQLPNIVPNSVGRVVSIAKNGIYFEAEVGEGICTFDRLQPIPLTPEILEKNGFDGAYKNTYQIYKSDGYDKLYISYWRGRLTIITSPDIRKKHSTNTIHIDCSYVHELQHCLSLFGIEKEIIL